MPEDICAPRIASLSEQAKGLETRASELATLNDDEQPERTTPAELDSLRSQLRAALKDSTPARAKTTLHTMIDGIRVHARDNIEPTFRVPAVRIDYGYMEPTGIEPVTSCLQTEPRGSTNPTVLALGLLIRAPGRDRMEADLCPYRAFWAQRRICAQPY
jgi:hypothetical protein